LFPTQFAFGTVFGNAIFAFKMIIGAFFSTVDFFFFSTSRACSFRHVSKFLLNLSYSNRIGIDPLKLYNNFLKFRNSKDGENSGTVDLGLALSRCDKIANP
jgi:hypothetical protein